MAFGLAIARVVRAQDPQTPFAHLSTLHTLPMQGACGLPATLTARRISAQARARTCTAGQSTGTRLTEWCPYRAVPQPLNNVCCAQHAPRCFRPKICIGALDCSHLEPSHFNSARQSRAQCCPRELCCKIHFNSTVGHGRTSRALCARSTTCTCPCVLAPPCASLAWRAAQISMARERDASTLTLRLRAGL